MQYFKKHTGIFIFSLLYIALSGYFAWIDLAYLSMMSIGLLAIYFAVFHTEWTYLALAFLAPISINIEEFTDGSIGLFLPTEPILFGLLILVLMQQLNNQKVISKVVWKSPIVWAAGFYLFWTFITSITSEYPIASFKFLLAKLWFIVPMLFLGPMVFKKKENITRFIWLLVTGMIIAIVYTLIRHSSYSFGEQEGHWVMSPLFKDHTIYGAAVAFITPLVFGLYFSKKHNLLMQIVIICVISIVLLGLYFSYTRAAWLSVLASLIVLVILKLKIRFSIIASLTIAAGIVLYFTFDKIQMELERVKSEHTTEKFGEKFTSAVNVTTDASNLERLNRWACAIDMFKERPIVGFGPGTYAFEYARFQRPENLTIISTNFGDLGNAHSEYLGPLAEMGFLGFIAILLIVIAIFYKGITLYNKWPSDDRETRTLLLVIILALVTYFVHGVLNNYLDTDKAAIPIWGFCAVIIALEAQLTNSQPKVKD